MRDKVKQLLCELLGYGENRLNCMRNVAGVLLVVTRMDCIQLDFGGFSQF